MKKKLIFVGLLIFGLSNILFAEEFDGLSQSSFFPSFSFNDSVVAPAFDLMASGNASDDYSSGQRAGMIGLNFLFGIGSYSAGHIGHGVILTLLEASGIALVALPSIMGWEVELSGKQDNKSTEKVNEGLTDNAEIQRCLVQQRHPLLEQSVTATTPHGRSRLV